MSRKHLILLVACAVMAAGLMAGLTFQPASAGPLLFCGGKVVTIHGSGTINGTEGDDVIMGSDRGDMIQGLGGNDTICGLGGNDTIIGDPGRPTLSGNNDVIYGGDGDDL